jgi:plasmid stabilization system protein ParE
MESGYKIFWTDNALNELENTFEYLETNFTYIELNFLAKEIDKIVSLISMNPKLFPESEIKIGIRKVVVAKYNTMYYSLNNNTIEIISFFSNRKSPTKLKL